MPLILDPTTAPPPETPAARTVNRLLAALTVEDQDGQQTPLMIPGSRALSSAEGLAGIVTRQVSSTATGMHGRVNRSRYRDGHAITLTGLVRGDNEDEAWDAYDAISRALASAVDTGRLMRWTAGGRELQQEIRLVALTPALEVGPNLLRYQAQLDAPDPRGYSQDEETALLAHTGGGGDTFPDTFPDLFAASTGWVTTAENLGTVPTPPEFILTGALTDPVVTMDGSDDAVLAISGEIASGDSLHVFTGPPSRRVLLNDTANRINLVDFAATRWFEIPPRTHTFRLTGTLIGPDAGVEIRFRHAYE